MVWYADRGRYVDFEDREDDGPYCELCGYDMEREECHACHGEGEFDLYEMNPIEYEPGEVERCVECAGEGMYWVCPNVPHKQQEKGAHNAE